LHTARRRRIAFCLDSSAHAAPEPEKQRAAIDPTRSDPKALDVVIQLPPSLTPLASGLAAPPPCPARQMWVAGNSVFSKLHRAGGTVAVNFRTKGFKPSVAFGACNSAGELPNEPSGSRSINQSLAPISTTKLLYHLFSTDCRVSLESGPADWPNQTKTR